MRTLFLVSIALLVGDSVAAQIPTQVAGYETYAVVAPIADAAGALPWAERHCAKYSRFAHFRRMDGMKAIFDCEARKVDRKPATTRGIY